MPRPRWSWIVFSSRPHENSSKIMRKQFPEEEFSIVKCLRVFPTKSFVGMNHYTAWTAQEENRVLWGREDRAV